MQAMKFGTYAMACPSEVDVPLPSSSNATSELRVADDCNKISKDLFSLYTLPNKFNIKWCNNQWRC